MDGTEVAESIGPLDTGETLKLLLFVGHYIHVVHYIHVDHVDHVVSDVRTQPARSATVSREVFFPSVESHY